MINGRKWFTTGARHPHARFVTVTGLSDPSEDAGRHARHSIVIVPFGTPGVEVATQVFGAMGLTDDTPLAYLRSWGRALRFVDGPDEVHKRGR